MVDDIKAIVQMSGYMAKVLNALERKRGISVEKQKAIENAANGFRTWRSVYLAELKEVFLDGGE